MNKVERLVYDMVKGNPKLKQFLRGCYQQFFDLLPKGKEYSKNTIVLKEGYFLGFHDIQPFSPDNSKLISNKLSFDHRMPNRGESIGVGFFDMNDGRFGNYVQIGESKAWNFHKGCRLQWLNKECVIFNTATQDHVHAELVFLDGATTSLSYPIDSVSACGKLASSFSYQRLEKYMPGYGYPYIDSDSFVDEGAPQNTGLFLVNVTSNTRKLLVSLAELAELSSAEMHSNSSHHYVTHSSFSNDSRFLAFLHRWVGEDKQKRFTKLMVYDLHENQLISLPLSSNMASHYVWNDSNQIIAYCNFEGVDCHALFDVTELSNSKKVAYPNLNFDGHQSFIDNNHFITDGYPDRRRMAKLYWVDIENNSSKVIASVYSPKKFQTIDFSKHIACDLHPRVSNDGSMVCFDTVKTGRRSIAVMKL